MKTKREGVIAAEIAVAFPSRIPYSDGTSLAGRPAYRHSWSGSNRAVFDRRK